MQPSSAACTIIWTFYFRVNTATRAVRWEVSSRRGVATQERFSPCQHSHGIPDFIGRAQLRRGVNIGSIDAATPACVGNQRVGVDDESGPNRISTPAFFQRSTLERKPTMSEIDKIVAAIFTASMCGRASTDQETYLQTYDEFLEKMAKRHHEKHKLPPITDEFLASTKRTPS
jgi:hypothetical protein